MDVKKLKVEIIKKLTGKNDINLLLLNGRSEQVKKYSKFNELVNIINSIYEIEDENELKNILKDITELEKDGKLYEIRQIDIESEIREEYASEYNDTATRYDKLSDEELEREATVWLRTHGAQSGRTAEQLVYYLLGKC